MASQEFLAEISSIHAYFPGDPRAFAGEIQEISKDADLATMRVDIQDLKRPLNFRSHDSGKCAAVTGEPVVLMGYATGLAGILARTDEDTAQQILTHGGSDVFASPGGIGSPRSHSSDHYAGPHWRYSSRQNCIRCANYIWRFRRAALQSRREGHRRHVRDPERFRRLEFWNSDSILGAVACAFGCLLDTSRVKLTPAAARLEQ